MELLRFPNPVSNNVPCARPARIFASKTSLYARPELCARGAPGTRDNTSLLYTHYEADDLLESGHAEDDHCSAAIRYGSNARPHTVRVTDVVEARSVVVLNAFPYLRYPLPVFCSPRLRYNGFRARSRAIVYSVMLRNNVRAPLAFVVLPNAVVTDVCRNDVAYDFTIRTRDNVRCLEECLTIMHGRRRLHARGNRPTVSRRREQQRSWSGNGADEYANGHLVDRGYRSGCRNDRRRRRRRRSRRYSRWWHEALPRPLLANTPTAYYRDRGIRSYVILIRHGCTSQNGGANGFRILFFFYRQCSRSSCVSRKKNSPSP
jgi:hypothetical protein